VAGSEFRHGLAGKPLFDVAHRVARRDQRPGCGWICFFLFWAINMIVIWRGLETINFWKELARRLCWWWDYCFFSGYAKSWGIRPGATHAEQVSQYI